MSHAIVITEFGTPDVLQWREVATPVAGHGEILVRVKAAGVGPTDLHIRAGHLTKAFAQGPGSVLGFEAAGVVEAMGEGVFGVRVGDEVAAYLADQGGYGELVATSVWFPKPAAVSWEAAAALPASAEAAVGVLREVRAAAGETLVILGAAGSVGSIAVQLAVEQGLRVIGTASPRDAAFLRDLGAEFVAYGEGAFDRIADLASHVDAVVDAAGRGGLNLAVEATGDPTRVVTLVGSPEIATSGAQMSHPGPDRAPDALAVTLPLLASGRLRLKDRQVFPISQAADAHRLLEAGEVHDKVVLTIA